MFIFLIIVELMLIVLTLAFIWYCVESVMNSLPGRVGYVSSNVALTLPILEKIIKKYVPNTRDVNFIEPGAGYSHISRFMALAYTWKSVTAIDITYSSLLIARLWNLRQKAPVTFRRANVFDVDYPKGSFIYCYLREPILDRLYQAGKFKGSLVVCLSFAITGVKPSQSFPLAHWQEKILVYDFR